MSLFAAILSAESNSFFVDDVGEAFVGPPFDFPAGVEGEPAVGPFLELIGDGFGAEPDLVEDAGDQ